MHFINNSIINTLSGMWVTVTVPPFRIGGFQINYHGTFSVDTYALMEAVAFDPTGSGRKDHVAFVGISNKRGYLWVIDTRQEAGSDRSGPVDIGDFTYMYDGNSFKVPTYANRSFLNIVAGDC